MDNAAHHKIGKKSASPRQNVFRPTEGVHPKIRHLFSNPIDFLDILDEIPIGVVILNLDRNIILMNKHLETLTGFQQREVCNVSCAHILRNNICLWNCPAADMDAGTESKCVDGNLINKDRQLIPVRITLAPLKNLEGELIGFLETIEDIRLILGLNEKVSRAYNFNNILGISPEMKKIFRILPTLAQSDSSVLITGETGTGKDMVAEAIHNASNRNKGPFVKINCGALPETLLESELFGHQKGAFTGAVENKPGRFRMAHNGTLFLTEIGDLPLSLQSKMLTFLDDREVFPLGSTKGFMADVRVIAATNRNLEKRVGEKRFRKDLLFRLNVVRIHLPPLRNRKGDIRLLLDHFLHAISTQLGRKMIGLSKKALDILLTYRYPGNVRELRNIIEYAAHICRSAKITPDHLPSYIVESGGRDCAEESSRSFQDDTVLDMPNGHGFSSDGEDWPEIEKRMILEALCKTGGRKNKAAVSLGWARSTLWRKMKQYNLS